MGSLQEVVPGLHMGYITDLILPPLPPNWGLTTNLRLCTVLVIVIMSVRPSVRPSVTLVDCVHIVRPTIMISLPFGNPMIVVFGDIRFDHLEIRRGLPLARVLNEGGPAG